MKKRAGWIRFLVVLVGALVGGACGKTEPDRPTPRAVSTTTPPAEAPIASPEPPLFDREGRLLPTDETFFGFPIPRGFHRTSSVDGLFVYESTTVPIGKLRAYVATRVLTTEIEDVGTSSHYFRNASVRDGERTDHRFDFFVSTVRGGVQLRIQDIPPPQIPEGATPADRERAVEEAWRRQQ